MNTALDSWLDKKTYSSKVLHQFLSHHHQLSVFRVCVLCFRLVFLVSRIFFVLFKNLRFTYYDIVMFWTAWPFMQLAVSQWRVPVLDVHPFTALWWHIERISNSIQLNTSILCLNFDSWFLKISHFSQTFETFVSFSSSAELWFCYGRSEDKDYLYHLYSRYSSVWASDPSNCSCRVTELPNWFCSLEGHE